MAAKKRFYKSVLLADDGLSIQLDGRNLRSPAGSLLRPANNGFGIGDCR